MEPNLIIYAIPFFVVTVILEAVLITREQRERWIEAKDSYTSIALGLGNVFTGLFTKALIFGIYTFLYENFRFFTLDTSQWWVWVLAFFADDFSYYWFHREAHLIRWFWASHKVHHSSEKYNLATALRQTWTGNASGSFVFYLWMPFVGFNPIVILTMQQISLLYQYWIHTEAINKMWRPFEYIFNTPSHHRVHHGSDIKYLDANYAGILIIWDRMFGTFVEEKERPTYGLVSNLNSYNPIKIAFSEWVDMAKDLAHAGSLKNAFKYIFAPPGWSPNGSRKTSEELKKEAGIK